MMIFVTEDKHTQTTTIHLFLTQFEYGLLNDMRGQRFSKTHLNPFPRYIY